MSKHLGTASMRNKKLNAVESDIEKARSEKDWNSLLSLLKKYSKITSSNDNVLEYLVHAERYIGDNNFIDAQVMLNKALLLKPDDQEVIAYIGLVDYHRNEINKSIDHLSRLSNPYTNQNNDMILNIRKVTLLVNAFNIKGKCLENQGRSEEAVLAYQSGIDVAFRYYKNFKLLDNQSRPQIIDSFIRIAMINRYFGKIQSSINDLRGCLSSQITLSESSYRFSLVTLGHLLLRNTCSSSYQPKEGEIQKQQTNQAYYVASNEVEEALLALLYAEHLQFTSSSFESTANTYSEADMSIYDDICIGYCRKEQYYPIVEMYEKSLSTRFGEPHRWVQLALSLYSSGKYKRSLFIIEESLAANRKNIPNPKSIPLILLGAKICINHLNQLSKGILLSKLALDHLVDKSDKLTLSKVNLSIGIAYEKKALECKSFNEKQSNQESALKYLREAYKYDSSDYNTSYHLALIYADIRETKLGLKYIQESLSINPNEPSSWNLLCLLLSSNKTYELAYTTCKHALSRTPTNIELLLTKAKLEIALEDGSQALITYKGALSHLTNHTLTSVEDWDETESLPRNRYQSGPSSIVSFDLKSNATSNHRGIGASSVYGSGVGGDDEYEASLSPTSGGLSGRGDSVRVSNSNNLNSIVNRELKRRVQLWLALAEAFAQQSMFDDAASCLTQADLITPNHPDVFYQQGVLLEIQEARQEAVQAYRRALAIDSGHTQSAIRIAVSYYSGDNNDLLLAENNLTTVLRSYDPTSHHAWFQLGVVLKAKGEIERASDCFKRAIELDKTCPLIPYDTISRHV